IDNWRLPACAARRRDLAVRYGRDGYRLLDAARGPRAPAWLGELPAVAALRQIWVQQDYRVIDEHGERGIWPEAGEHGPPPGRTRTVFARGCCARAPRQSGGGGGGANGAPARPPGAPRRVTGRPASQRPRT